MVETSDRSSSFEGRRLPDTRHGDYPIPYDGLEPGDYWKVLDRETGEPVVVTGYASNLTGTKWTVIAPGPNGLLLMADLEAHTVREEEDGTISVRPGDGSSNSIKVSRRPDETWHGYIEHGLWSPV